MIKLVNSMHEIKKNNNKMDIKMNYNTKSTHKIVTEYNKNLTIIQEH